MSKIKEDKSRVRLEVDGKQAVSELGKLEMKSKEYKVNLSNIKQEQQQWIKESKNLDKLKTQFQELVNKARNLKEENKQGTKTYEANQKKIQKVAVELKKAQLANDKLLESQQKYTAEAAKLDGVKTKIEGLRKSLGLSGMTMGQLVRNQKELVRELNNTSHGTARYKELKHEIQQVNGVIRQQRAELNGTSGFFSKMGKELKAFGVVALGYLGVTAFLGQMQSLISGSAKLSDELADVQKTTGLTDVELSKLSTTIKNMDTRTARSELRGLAEIAGRLGLTGVKDIEGFINAADKINVSLGDQLGDPEAVMRQLGKLTSTFGVTQEFGIEQALLKVGSAINELGMASTANEGYLVEFAKRMGGIAPLAKISIENILGLGATLDSLGQTSEVSTTALSKLFIAMAKDADQYAKYAKMEVQDFVNLLNTDANEAFVRMLEGVKDNSNGITELASTLGDLGQDGGRVVGVLGTLANNTETLRKQQEISNAAFKEGTSVINEFNLKNTNMAANLEKIQKWLAGMFINSSVMNGLNAVVGKWAEWVQIPLSQKLGEERIAFNNLYAQIITTNTGTEERIKLIKELKNQYPKLLKDINADTVSNEQLAVAVKNVNEQLINRIIIQRQQEDIDKQAQKLATQKMKVIEQENDLRNKAIKLSEKYKFELKAGVSPVEQFTDALEKARVGQDKYGQMLRGRAFNDVTQFGNGIGQLTKMYGNLNAMEGFNNELLEKKNQLMDQLGIKMEDFGGESDFQIPDDPTEPNSASSSLPDDNKEKDRLDKLAKLWEDYKDKIIKTRRELELSALEDDERDRERAKEKYAELELDLATHFANKTISDEEFTTRLKEIAELREIELGAIDDKYREINEKKKEEDEAKKLDAEKKILEATIGDRELAELKVQEHYQALLDLAEQYGIDKAAILERREEALAELAKKHKAQELQEEATKYEAKKQMAMDFASVATGVMGLVANFSGDIAKYDKTMAIAKAVIGSGEAIANMIKMFTATSFTPIDLAAKIAAGTGIILGNINSAIRTVNRTSIPDAPDTPDVTSSPTRGRITTAKPKSYFFGGSTGDGMGIGDKHGEFAGFVHKHEYVLPQIVTQDPRIANLLPAIESIRQDKIRGFAQGGGTGGSALSPSAPALGSDPEIKELLRMLVSKMDAMPKKLKAYLVYSDLEEMKEEMEGLRDRYKA